MSLRKLVYGAAAILTFAAGSPALAAGSCLSLPTAKIGMQIYSVRSAVRPPPPPGTPPNAPRPAFEAPLLVDSRENQNLVLASRNNPRLKTVDALAVNVYDVVDRHHLVFTEAALNTLLEVLKK